MLTWRLSFITEFKQVHSALTKLNDSSQIVQQARSATYLCFKHIPGTVLSHVLYIPQTVLAVCNTPSGADPTIERGRGRR